MTKIFEARIVQYMLGGVYKHTRTEKAGGLKKVKFTRNLCAIARGFLSNWVKLEMRDNTSFSFETGRTKEVQCGS